VTKPTRSASDEIYTPIESWSGIPRTFIYTLPRCPKNLRLESVSTPKHYSSDLGCIPTNMTTNQDRPYLIVAGLVSVMLVLVLTGDLIPLFPRSIIYSTCIMGIFTVVVLRNILKDARGIVFWRLYAIGMAIMFCIIIAIIVLHERFETGDALILGMKPATTLMVFGPSLFPFWFLLLWVIGFRRAIVPQEREDHLNRLMSQDTESEDNADG